MEKHRCQPAHFYSRRLLPVCFALSNSINFSQLLDKASTQVFTELRPEQTLPQGGNIWQQCQAAHHHEQFDLRKIYCLDVAGRWMSVSDISQVLWDSSYTDRAICLTCQLTWTYGYITSQLHPSASLLSYVTLANERACILKLVGNQSNSRS